MARSGQVIRTRSCCRRTKTSGWNMARHWCRQPRTPSPQGNEARAPSDVRQWMGREYSSLPMFLYEVPVMPDVVLTVDLPLPRFGSGKVRETFDLGDRLLMVTTDRMSAFDV